MSFKIRKLKEEPGIDELEEGFKGVNSTWVVLKREDLSGFSSRIFRIEPGGHTPMHTHDREHIAVLIKGKCRVEAGREIRNANEGCIITLPGNIPHKFSNPSNEKLVLHIMNLFTDRAH